MDKAKRVDLSLLPPQFILMDDKWTSDDEVFQNGRIANKYNVLLFFLTSSTLRATFQDRKPYMGDMEAAKNEFLFKLMRSGNVVSSAMKNIQSVAMYNWLDRGLDGIALSFQFELTQNGIDYCFPGSSYLIDEHGNFILDDKGNRILI